MNVALREGQHDAAVGHQLVDPEAEIAFDFPLVRGPQIDPEAELEQQGVGSEVLESDGRDRVGENLRMFVSA